MSTTPGIICEQRIQKSVLPTVYCSFFFCIQSRHVWGIVLSFDPAIDLFWAWTGCFLALADVLVLHMMMVSWNLRKEAHVLISVASFLLYNAFITILSCKRHLVSLTILPISYYFLTISARKKLGRALSR
jgi:hypothetical protein